ncbi:sensor histidine kinase [Ihubacter sp. rT4E-8]|uniref:sensor histidine kinase n=1 Tax=unclassified Ihubacter TaxID=2633299 RepID=UPI00137ADE95
MDTKWKNTTKSVKGFLKSNRKMILGIVLAAISILPLWIIMHNIGLMKTSAVWTLGIIGYFPLAGAVMLLLPETLSRIYRDWIPQNGEFYEEWQKKRNRQQKILLVIFIALFIIAVLFFRFQKATAYYYYYMNLAQSYYLILTVILLYILCEANISRFMRKRLDMMMEKVTAINKARLEEAIEMERRSLEKAAKSEQLKVDLISNVSHDLKTPLTSMVGYLELLKKEELQPIAEDYVEVISDKAEKLKEMIESLFSLAKASSGNITLVMESIEMNMLIEQIFADLEDRVKNSGLQFIFQLTEEDTHLISDNIHMYRICQNLIENAVKYSAKGTRVFVKTYVEKRSALEESRICLEIVNTAGYLMDFEKEDIVERFARGDKARSSDGNGLGLAIVSTYTSAMGGAFDISIDCDQFKAKLSFPAEASRDEAALEETDAADVR